MLKASPKLRFRLEFLLFLSGDLWQPTEAFDRLVWAAHNTDSETARAVIRAASFPSASPASVSEYMKAVDALRDDQNRIITGLLDQATVGATINARRVGNSGLGSMAEGFEPVAMHRLVLRGSVSQDNIQAFGFKIPTAGIDGVSTGTIEADCLLKDLTFIDTKHSLTGDPFISDTNINNVKAVLALGEAAPIKRAWFVTNGPVDAAVADKIRAANQHLRDVLGVEEDLITLVTDVGGYR